MSKAGDSVFNIMPEGILTAANANIAEAGGFIKSLEGKYVHILCNDGEELDGRITDYFPEDENDDDIACVSMDHCPQHPDQWLGLSETDIKELKVLE